MAIIVGWVASVRFPQFDPLGNGLMPGPQGSKHLRCFPGEPYKTKPQVSGRSKSINVNCFVFLLPIYLQPNRAHSSQLVNPVTSLRAPPTEPPGSTSASAGGPSGASENLGCTGSVVVHASHCLEPLGWHGGCDAATARHSRKVAFQAVEIAEHS